MRAHLHAWWASQSLREYLAPLAASRGDPLFLLKNLPWFAWPALPLVLWTLWTRGRGFNGGLGTPAVQLPGVLALAIIVAIAAMGQFDPTTAVRTIVALATVVSFAGASHDIVIDAYRRDVLDETWSCGEAGCSLSNVPLSCAGAEP